ncbi:hypothetical protein V5P93_002934 [Actinokineospora auranticolor]|uniref:Glutathionylspermidine synthase n=1 Tax=Actinokineospora auranticolor TaxID=155976 RepID=A0A2S6H0R3_9PSEU|nr:hypothetical protein [Actinokineospora auranticolor]PPK71075.1 hypothetical protein CLV40_101261 [Actinokineospora auranticolor]
MTTHPWFGAYSFAPTAPAPVIRERLHYEIRDTGWPYQPFLPAAPIALPRASHAELFRAASALLDLVRRTALETADTTEGRLKAYRMPESEHRLFVADQLLEERYADRVARPDVVIGPDGPKFLEFNVSGALGGPIETHCRMAVWRDLYGIDGLSPFGARAAMFRDLCVELGVSPRVAIVGSARDQGVSSTRYFDLESEYFGALGLHARFFEPEDLHGAWDCAPESRYGVGLRNFTIPDWEGLGIDMAPVQEALDHGCLLVGTQTSTFLSSKVTMGLLSEGRPWMTTAERALVAKYLPWTRVLTDRRTTWEDREVDLLRFTVDTQERLVLKAGLGMSGEQVMIGRDTAPGEWESAVTAAAEVGTSVVQEHVTPQTCSLWVIPEEGDEAHQAEVAPVLGPLLFGSHPAGIMTRFYADGKTGIVSVYGGSASDTCAVAV